MLDIIILSAVFQRVIILRVYIPCHYTHNHFTESCSAGYNNNENSYAECHCAECHYTECHYAKCRSNECGGVLSKAPSLAFDCNLGD